MGCNRYVRESQCQVQHCQILSSCCFANFVILVSHANYLGESVASAVHEHLDSTKINDDDTNKSSRSTPINIKHLRTRKNNNGNSLPPQILCVEAICDIVVEQLPDLWRLGQSYFTGQLHVAVDVEKQSHFKV